MEVSNPKDIAYSKILRSTEGEHHMRHWRIGVEIVLPILIFLSSANTFAHGTTRGYKFSEIVEKAEIICTATVVSTQCQWEEDHRGNHIYTHVELLIGQKIKGQLPSNYLDLEIVGGTVDDITEFVSDSPIFVRAEQVLLFIEGEPLHLVGGIMGKRPIFDGQVFWGGRKVSLEALSSSVALGTTEVFAESDEVVFADDISTGPVITSITPDIGSAGTGTQVTIHGTGFGRREDSGKVEFFYQEGESRIEASDISSWEDTQIICTVPTDIIDRYPASAGSGLVTVTTWSATSNGYPFRVTFSYDGCHWSGENPVVSYYINENFPDCDDEGAAVQAAAETWNSTGAGIRFQYADSHTNTTASKNGDSEIMWGTIRSEVLGATYNQWRQTVYDINGFPVGERFLEVDMVLNQDYNWTTDPSAPEYDVQSIALHEFGHFLCLRDLYGDIGDGEYDAGKVMYGIGEALKRDLHPDDVAGIHWIYNPTNPPAILDSISYPSSDDDGYYVVNWTSCSEASSYQLERSTDGADWVQVYTGPHTYFEEIVEDGNYRYRVAASNSAGSSAWQTGDNCLVRFSIWEGSGEPNDPFLINTAEQLDRIGTHSRWWSRHFKLIADIDLSGYDGQNGRPAFHVIAPNDESEYWTGVFDGNDHIISNLTYISSKPGHTGLFGCMADPNAEVKRLGLVGSRIEAEVNDRVGSLIGLLKEGTITVCYTDDTSIRGKSLVGGLVGENVNGNIINCDTNNVNVSGTNDIGGLVGKNSGLVSTCSCAGIITTSVSGKSCVGGLVGVNESGNIVNCYTNTGVSGKDDVGGLVGYNSGNVSTSSCAGIITAIEYVGGLAGSNMGTIIQSYSHCKVNGGAQAVGGLVGENNMGRVDQCYSAGRVEPNGEYVGGLVGNDFDGNIDDSFWDIETSNQPTSSGGTGKTTAEMQTASTFLEAGWDFVAETANGIEDIWWILDGLNYPRLWWEQTEE